MFKALKAIKKIKQLQKEMHAFSLAFLAQGRPGRQVGR